jgi:glycosyltransferase involved in cell wall biosynthesis
MLAEVLSRRFKVEIIGPATHEDGVWLPCRDSDIPVRWTPQGRIFGLGMVRRLLSMTRGKMVYAIKPRFTSYGVGLLAQKYKHLPLVVDIDDWEMGFYLEYLRSTKRYVLADIGNSNNLATTWLMEKLVGRADAVTISSDFIMKRFGGTKIPHARDTKVLDPARFDREALRAEKGWSDHTVAIFLGTPTLYKGIDTLIAAARLVDEPGLKVVIAGAGPRSELWNGKVRMSDTNIEIIGLRPFEEMPATLAAADIAVIPQNEGPATIGQVPVKLIDAMAMGKAIVASAVSDIPRIIDGCGIVCKPGDADDLAAKLTMLASDEEMRKQIGAKARARCIERHSYDALEEPLTAIFEELSLRSR